MDAEDWLAPAGDSIFLNLTHTDANGNSIDLFDDDFNPVYTHQLFEDEAIFGYKGLEMKLYFRDHDMRPTFEAQYEDKWEKQGKIEAVDYEQILSDLVPKSAFSSQSPDETDYTSWTPPGTMVNEYETDGDKYQVWQATLTDPASKQIFRNLAIIIPFFIEGGTCMDLDNPEAMIERWTIYYLYKLKDATKVGPRSSKYSFVGFSSAYRWWVYPSPPIVQRTNASSGLKGKKKDGSETAGSDAPIPADITPLDYFKKDGDESTMEPCSRLTLSQFVLLPPYQRQGHGAHLYRTIFNQAITNPAVFEFCVEDPNEDFDCLRDFCDFTHLRSNPDFRALALPTHIPPHTLAPKAPVPAALLLPKKTITNLHNKSKLTRRQFDRMLEIHLFSQFPTSRRSEYLLNGLTICADTIKYLTRPGAKSEPPASKDAQYNVQYTLWSILVKNRIFLKNEDVLRQLDDSERPERVNEAFNGVQAEYAEWIETLIRKGVLSDDTLLVPQASSSAAAAAAAGPGGVGDRKRKANEMSVSGDVDDDDSVLGQPLPKRASVEPTAK